VNCTLKGTRKPAPTFEEYANTWMTFNVPATCKPSTEKDYRSILDNHVLPAFGKKPVTEIKRMMIKKFLMGKIKPVMQPVRYRT
jgi:integrase